MVEQAAELGRLSLLVADLDRRAGEARTALQDRREQAFARLTEAQEAAASAAAAADRVTAARVATGAAGSAIEEAQQRLDGFVAATYQQTIDLGPLGLLTDLRAGDVEEQPMSSARAPWRCSWSSCTATLTMARASTSLRRAARAARPTGCPARRACRLGAPLCSHWSRGPRGNRPVAVSSPRIAPTRSARTRR